MRFGSPTRSPQGLPEPRPYGHLTPEDGACLMETASVLAAEPFTDSPPGTDPALAALARAVNDAVGDRARRRLLPLAADLAAARPPRRSFTPGLIADVLGAARAVRSASPNRLLTLRERRCRRRALRLAGAGPGRLPGLSRARDTMWWRGPGRHHLEHALRVLLRAPDAEDRLVSLLHDAVAAASGRPRPRPATPTNPRADSPAATVG
jgi:hypothetical protein